MNAERTLGDIEHEYRAALIERRAQLEVDLEKAEAYVVHLRDEKRTITQRLRAMGLPDTAEEIGTFDCAHCDRTFTTRQGRIVHTMRMHKAEAEAALVTSSNGNGDATIETTTHDIDAVIAANMEQDQPLLDPHPDDVVDDQPDPTALPEYLCGECEFHTTEKAELLSHTRVEHKRSATALERRPT